MELFTLNYIWWCGLAVDSENAREIYSVAAIFLLPVMIFQKEKLADVKLLELLRY